MEEGIENITPETNSLNKSVQDTVDFTRKVVQDLIMIAEGYGEDLGKSKF